MWFNLTPHAIGALAGLYALLLLGQIVVWVLTRRRPNKDYTELNQRVRTWWIIIGFFTLMIAGPSPLQMVFFAFVSFLAFREYMALIPTRRADRRVLIWAYLSIPFQYYWVGLGWFNMFLIFIPVFVLMLLPLRMVMIGQTKGFINAAGTLHLGLMANVFSLSHIAYLMVLPEARNPAGGGAGLVIFLFLMTELNDVAQYIWGKRFGRRKIIPLVSPNKTWEGFIGGLLTMGCIAAFLGPYLTPLSPGRAFGVGLLLSTAGFFGDVVESAVKRDIGVKDAGVLLPGHGGILDRIDSLVYTAPVFFHLINWLYY